MPLLNYSDVFHPLYWFKLYDVNVRNLEAKTESCDTNAQTFEPFSLKPRSNLNSSL